MPHYAIMRVAKIKTVGAVVAMEGHSERTRATPNADPSRRDDNARVLGEGSVQAAVQAKLDTVTRMRKDAILALDVFMGGSREYFDGLDAATLATWEKKSIAWVQDTYGAANVVGAWLHRDETSPHIAALVVPLTPDGRLNAHHYIGSGAQLRAQQDSYAAAVKDVGLERGIKGSAATHQDVKDWYAKIDTPAHAVERALTSIEVGTRPRLGNLGAWKAQEKERIVEQVRPAVDAALTQAAHHQDRAERAEATAGALQRTVDTLQAEKAAREQEQRDSATRARRLDLREVARALGGAPDPRDKHLWRIEGAHINISTDGHAFYDLDRQRGAGGAIDLVTHVTGYRFKEALGWLKDSFGLDRATAAAVERATPRLRAQAERAERPPFRPPVRDEAAWAQVRAYLVTERGLPAPMIDELHGRGTVYADGRCNAVFLRTNSAGQATGASLRGTAPDSAFKGLARDTERAAGWFSYSTGAGAPAHAWDTPTLVLAESPIDALSWLALHARQAGQAGRVTVVSTDGLGPLPEALIAATRAERGLVVAAFDHDTTGERLWDTLRGRYPNATDIEREIPPAGKDVNDALRRHQQGPARDRAGSGRGH